LHLSADFRNSALRAFPELMTPDVFTGRAQVLFSSTNHNRPRKDWRGSMESEHDCEFGDDFSGNPEGITIPF
jgi:hypothetical protein